MAKVKSKYKKITKTSSKKTSSNLPVVGIVIAIIVIILGLIGLNSGAFTWNSKAAQAMCVEEKNAYDVEAKKFGNIKKQADADSDEFAAANERFRSARAAYTECMEANTNDKQPDSQTNSGKTLTQICRPLALKIDDVIHQADATCLENPNAANFTCFEAYKNIKEFISEWDANNQQCKTWIYAYDPTNSDYKGITRSEIERDIETARLQHGRIMTDACPKMEGVLNAAVVNVKNLCGLSTTSSYIEYNMCQNHLTPLTAHVNTLKDYVTYYPDNLCIQQSSYFTAAYTVEAANNSIKYAFANVGESCVNKKCLPIKRQNSPLICHKMHNPQLSQICIYQDDASKLDNNINQDGYNRGGGVGGGVRPQEKL